MSLPKYQSHKIVEAAKITGMLKGPEGTTLMFAESEDITVDLRYVEKHEPQIGGYYVRYEDGYESWSPADAFEGGYTRIAD